MMNMTPSKELVTARLSEVPIFSDMTVEDLEALAEIVRFRSLPRGAVIVGQQEGESTMFLLASGRVKISLANPGGKELVLSYQIGRAHV